MAVVGPTATGKTALGVALAEQFGGEVISADSDEDVYCDKTRLNQILLNQL